MDGEKQEPTFIIPSVESQHSHYFEKITELKAGDVIIKAPCKFCNHPLRAEAEAQWEQSKGGGGRGSYSLVVKFLNSKSDQCDGVKFNHQNVSVHLNHHYEQQIKRLRMREYGRRLAEVMNYKIEKDTMFEGIIQALQLKLFEVASDTELDPYKQADMMSKLSKSIVDVSTSQAKLRGEIDVLDVYKEKVQNIFVNFISSEQDEQRQRALLEQLETLKVGNE